MDAASVVAHITHQSNYRKCPQKAWMSPNILKLSQNFSSSFELVHPRHRRVYLLLSWRIYVIVFNPPYCFKLSYYDIYYYTKVPILSNSIAKLERNSITKLVPFHSVPSVHTCKFLIHKDPSILVILTRDLQTWMIRLMGTSFT